jgi:hypothetical protein
MENENYKSTEIYNQLINNITKATRKGSQNSHLRNNITMSKNPFNQEEMIKNNYQINEQSNDKEGNYNTIYDKMNHKIINKRRTVEFNQNSYNNSKINPNGNENANKNQNNQNKIFYDNTGEYPLGGGKNAPIVKILNQYNNQAYSQNYELKNSQNNNNYYNPFINKNNSYEHNENHINPNNPFNTIFPHQNEGNNINENKNNFSTNNGNGNLNISTNNFLNYNNVLEISRNNDNELDISKDENLSNPKERSKLMPSLLYGLIFGSFGTLLLWCKNRRVRDYLKNCYHNINSESILNFLKSFLHPKDLIKSLGINAGVLKEILKQSYNYLSGFIDEYSDLWRLLSIIIVVYAFWIIIKKIYRLLVADSKEKDKKEIQKNEEFQKAYFLN